MYTITKRILDLFLAILALVILLPLFVPIIILLAFTGEREIFFLQRRIGYRNKPFYIWKFATMVKDSPNIGTGEITLRNDPRVTKIGAFLRKTKINELPQLINVIKGEMSMVGPRPFMEVSFNLFDEKDRGHIYQLKPGITGIGSLVFRDEEKVLSAAADPRAMYNRIFLYKAELEAWYRKHISFFTDFKILFLTGWSVLFPHQQLAVKWFTSLPPRPKQF